jgi:flagellin
MLVTNTNTTSLVAQANLNKAGNALSKSFERLSTGSRINSAQDDPAGLAVSEGLKGNMRCLTQSNKNASNAISMLQIADGAMGEMASILLRLNELATQGANNDLSAAQRVAIGDEAATLTAEIDAISNVTKFNGIELLSESASSLDFQVGPDGGANSKITINWQQTSASTLGVDSLDFSSSEAASESLTAVIAAIDSLSTSRGSLGASANRMESAMANNTVTLQNLANANSLIRDTDVAEETSTMTTQMILSQAGAAVLAQANQAPQLALKLIE